MIKNIKKLKIILNHIVSDALIILSIFLLTTAFKPCGIRAWQGLKDLVFSFWYMITGKGTATVKLIPAGMKTILPLTLAELKAVAVQSGKLFISLENFKAFLYLALKVTFYTVLIILVVAMLATLFVLYLRLRYKAVNNNHNVDTVWLKGFLKIEGLFIKLKRYILEFWGFLLEHKIYIILFLSVWAISFNLLTIPLELIAFLFYFIRSFDLENILVQIAKLFVDIGAFLSYMPFPLYMIVGYKIFDYIRREQGFEIMEDFEAASMEVLENHPGDILATGKRRSGKTKAITYLQKLQEKIYRKTAKSKSFDRRMQFPYFPWVVLEQSIIEMRNQVPTFCLVFLWKWLERMEYMFQGRVLFSKEEYDFELQKFQKFGYTGHDFCFDYKVDRYPMKYDSGAEIVKLFHCIKQYATEFYIYSTPSPMVFSNYPMKVYIRWEDYGNYPLIDEDNTLLRVPTDEIEEYYQFSHKYYFDMGRLGMQKNPEGEYNNNFEFGIVGISEAGKEYGNQKTNTGYKPDECNPNNDLASLNIKMEGHGRTYDNEPYLRKLMDEQRPSSVMADMLDTLTEMRVIKRDKAEIVLPCFKLETKLYLFCRDKVEAFLDYMNCRHGENTLMVHLVYGIYGAIHNFYWRAYNQFSVEVLHVKFVDHSSAEDLGEAGEELIYIPTREIVGAYKTGYFATIYEERAKRSPTGGNDQVPQYETLDTRIEDMQEVGSHFYDKILGYLDMDESDEDNNYAVFLQYRMKQIYSGERKYQ